MPNKLFTYPVGRGFIWLSVVLSVLVFLVISVSAAPTEPIPNLPTPTPEAEPADNENIASIPPIPDELPPEAELQRARQAIAYALDKHFETWGIWEQVELFEVRAEGSWAYGLANSESGQVYILAHRYSDGQWQAIMPDDEGAYIHWLEQLPDSLLTQEMKESTLLQIENWVQVLPEEPRNVFEESLLPIPTPAPFDGVGSLQPENHDGILISNSLFLFSSTVLDFDIQLFLDSQTGPLSYYSEEIDGQLWTAAEIIEYNAFLFGVNPQVILVMLESDSELITNADALIPSDYSIGQQGDESIFYKYVNNMADQLLSAYDSWRYGQSENAFHFPSGKSITISDDLNAGTFAVQAVLAQFLSITEWDEWVKGNGPGFIEKFQGWFGDPILDINNIQDFGPLEISALPGGYILPFPIGETWYYNSGPHTYSGSGARPWSSIDLAQPEVIGCPGGTYPSHRWIVAAKGGNVIASSQGLVIIDHGDGWRTYYSHVATADRRGLGSINQGDYVGHPSCEIEPNGSTNGVHVHFAIWQSGIGFVDISGSSLSGWLIQESTHYNGTMIRNGVQRIASIYRTIGYNDILNSGVGGTCAAPSLNSPANGQTMNNRTITMSWNAPSCSGLNGYTLHVTTGTGPENGIILDTGVGQTQHTWTFPSDGTFYWHVAAWANGQRGLWSSRQVVINTSSGVGTGNWSANYYDSTDRWWDDNNTANWRCSETIAGPVLDKNYGSGTPCSGMNGDTWVGNYQATINFPSGTYVFYVDHDDGAKVWINGQERAVFSSSGTNSKVCNGTTGYYLSGNNSIRVLLREDYGDARIRVTWDTNTTNCLPPAPSVPTLQSPANGTVLSEGQSTTLAWNSATNANEYYAEFFGGPAGVISYGWQSSTSWSIGAQWAGYSYSWRVKARNAAGESEWSSDWTFTVQPATPTALTGSVLSGSTVSLNWQDNSGNEEGYRIYRNGVSIGSVGANSTSYQDGGLACGTTYSYYVRAYRSSIDSNASNTIQITTAACIPAAPTANFDAWPQSGYVPLTVAFHNTSSGNYTSCLWNYGDGNSGTSCTAYHDHIYTTPGNYTVSLTVTGPGGADTRTITDYITAIAVCPNPDIPMLTYPADGAYVANNTPTLQWSSVSNANEYQIELSIFPTFGGVIISEYVGTPQYTTPEFLGGAFYWRVRSLNTANGCYQSSNWSQVREFTVDTFSPTVNWVSPVNNNGTFVVGDQHISLVVDAIDDRSMSHVNFWRWDAINLQWVYLDSDYSQPYQYELDTTTLNYSWNQINAWAFDSAGNSWTEYIWVDRLDCADANEPNNEPGNASSIFYEQAASGTICGVFDEDYYSFNGTAGDRVVIDIDAQALGSPLDSYIYLIDTDGETVLALNDDAEGSLDSKLGYILQSDGTYYIKVRAYAHGYVGDPNQFYTLNLYTDYGNPVAEIVSPVTDSWIDVNLETIIGEASDAESGVRDVTFWYHDSTILEPYWFWMSGGSQTADGWTIDLNTSIMLEQQGIAIVFRAHDWVGNYTDHVAYNLGLDRTPPISAVEELAPIQTGVTFLVAWSGTDSLSGIATNGYDIQYRDGASGNWTNWLTDTGLTSAYFTGQEGHTYYFRTRARDNAGNQEPYLVGDGDTSTTIDLTGCYTLTRSYTGSGSTPTAIPDNSSGCPAGQYNAGETITLIPHPASNHHLGFWSGTSGSASSSFVMPTNYHAVSAHYAHSGPISVAILDHASTQDISYWIGGNSNYWNTYRLILENDPEKRFAVTIVTELSSATLANFDRLLLPDNAVPDAYLVSVNSWFTSEKQIIAVDSAVSYAAYSGFMWPTSVGDNGYAVYWDYGSGYDDQVVLIEDKITENYAINSIIPSFSGDAQFFRSQLPDDALAVTAKQSNHDHVYVAYRQVPDKGVIVVLGPFSWPGAELDMLIRAVIQGPVSSDPPLPADFRIYLPYLVSNGGS